MKHRSIPVLLAGLVLACGPVGPCPGGRLEGEVGPAVVSSWSFADDVETAELETRPDSPLSVHTWFIALADRLYVPTSMIRGLKDPTRRAWVEHVGQDPLVRIRVGEKIFERRAVRIVDAEEYARVRGALEEKYGLDPSARDPEREVWIDRLDARSG